MTPDLYDLVDADTGTVVAVVERPRNWLLAGVGVIGRPSLPAKTGIWLPNTASIHTFFVRFPLDLLFLDRNFSTLRTVTAARPWRVVRQPGARHVIELATGTLGDGRTPSGGARNWRLLRRV